MLKAIRPTQPYFVLDTPKFYQGIYKQKGISHFYSFHATEKDKDIMTVPDGCIDVIFEYGHKGMNAKVCGTVLTHKEAFHCKDHEYFGIRFLPGVKPAFLQGEMKNFVEQTIDLEQVCTDYELVKRMENTVGFEQRIHCFFGYYEKEEAKQESESASAQLAQYVKNQIYENRGQVKIKDLEE